MSSSCLPAPALSDALMEAMACGCCPVASDVAGNPELVTPMETGLLFQPGNVEDLAARIAKDFSTEAAGRRMGRSTCRA